MNKHGELRKKGKLIVFQMCGETDSLQRLIVYDESDEMADDKGNHRYIGESCAGTPGWKYGDPDLCATHQDGSIFILDHYEVRVKHMESHFYTVWVKRYQP
ncbi:hypothetical protein MTBLM1_10521 [Rhodospirillaceae bacterium LM-1]|nr:hypothetical protein MTBLM1_10521 [Rhodospirillaceae bacterium LM-1]